MSLRKGSITVCTCAGKLDSLSSSIKYKPFAGFSKSNLELSLVEGIRWVDYLLFPCSSSFFNVKYLLFDLEATKKENIALRKKLEEQGNNKYSTHLIPSTSDSSRFDL